MSFATVCFLTILTHLWKTYGVLEYFGVQKNDDRMKELISAATLFEDFADKVEITINAVDNQVHTQ